MSTPPGSARNLLPSLPVFLFYLLAAVISLLIATARDWFGQLVGPEVDASFFSQIQQRSGELLALVQDPSASGLSATLTTLVFWLVVGAGLYMLLWLLYALIHAVINEIELSLIFVHPQSFKESNHWLAFVSRVVLRIAAVLVVFGYSVLFLKVIWPAVVIQFGYGLLSPTLLSISTQVLGGVVTLVVAIHLLLLLVRVVLWRKA